MRLIFGKDKYPCRKIVHIQDQGRVSYNFSSTSDIFPGKE